MKTYYPESGKSPLETCGVSFLQTVYTVYGMGTVQGILKNKDGTLQVIVAHKPGSIPPEMIPAGSNWKLIHYNPDEVYQAPGDVPQAVQNV
ncbi:MAG: hypothetical protein M0R06_08325 [Sphaerochaeta sp.]|jgi:hypothetical protein|nr:hypothetical protein [Sphaerochaeta sp.]